MQMESLSLFLAVAESKSIAKAAQRLYITPQGASAAIIALEKQLDVRLFDRSGAALELTKEGEAIAAEAERVVGSYRRLQSVAALQGGSPASRERFRVVVSPFAKRTLAPVIEEFGRIGDDDRVVDLVEASVYDMARRYDRLDAGTLYVLDLPMDLGIVAGDLPPGFLDAVLNDPGFFEPFLLSSFMLRCADGSAYSKKPWVRWSDLDMDKIACHNDAFLEQMIRHYLGRAGDGEPGMKVTNPDLLDAAVREQGMVSLFGSFPVIFRERNRQPTGGVAVELRPEASFVTGVVGGAGNAQASAFLRFMQRLLRQSFSSYMRRNDPDRFFEENGAARP
ncbi:LysR family transcriptional regulator [Eggerthella guodeyinii]|uniref:LysR family transcriptional regulator n=1 Tax=Eggerthella guodeyinii TaxID=2690837 RepID=A0A6L7ITC6_9ACTN|nr:LysR family transcriptional regulator [Eggerthella guodeyinii]QOS66679.1 LysR family transcriptional regulator [Eggerthella guodeyinii]